MMVDGEEDGEEDGEVEEEVIEVGVGEEVDTEATENEIVSLSNEMILPGMVAMRYAV